jgi:hypothetical protein
MDEQRATKAAHAIAAEPRTPPTVLAQVEPDLASVQRALSAVLSGMRKFCQLLVMVGDLFIPPALRDCNIRLRKFVSCRYHSMLHFGAIAL